MGIGFLVLVALGFVLWPEHAGPLESAPNVATVPSVAGAVEPPREGGEVRGDPPRGTRPLTAHGPEQLSRFILPLVEGRNVSLPDGVKLLMTAYRDACRRSRATPLDLEFEFPEEDAARISFSIERGDFGSVLRRVAGLAGFREHFNGLMVSFTRLPDAPELVARKFTAPAAFRESIEKELHRLGVSHGPLIGELLAAAGLIAPERQAELGEDGTLQVTATAAELQRLEARIAEPNPVQIKAEVRIILSEQSLVEDLETLTAAQLTELLLSIAGKSGVKVTTMPSVTTREQQSADIEVVRKYPGGWTGLRISLEAERVGLAILTRDVVEYRPEDHPKPYAQDTRYGFFKDGEPQISLVAKRDGKFIYRILTVELIDAGGRPLRSPDGAGADGYEVAKPVPDSPGMVYSPYNGKVVDVREIPSGTLVADPMYPPSEKKFFRVP